MKQQLNIETQNTTELEVQRKLENNIITLNFAILLIAGTVSVVTKSGELANTVLLTGLANTALLIYLSGNYNKKVKQLETDTTPSLTETDQ